MKYFERKLFDEIIKWLDRREIIAIKGPRQSGKTTLLEMIKEFLIKKKRMKEENVVFITFEDRELLEQFVLNPRDFVKRYARGKEKFYFLMDEVHYIPEIGQKLKLLYDTFKNIKFIITGSSSLEVLSETAKYLVGRVFSFELYPFDFYEFLNARDRNLAQIYKERKELIKKFLTESKNFRIEKDIYVNEILHYLEEFLIFGSYPEVIKSEDEEEKKMVLKNIYSTYLEKDIISFLRIRDDIKFKRFVSVLAFKMGDVIKYESLALDLRSYYKEVQEFLDILEQTYIIKRIRPFFKNMVTEIKKNPKVYFIDTGLRNYAIKNFSPLSLREDSGKLAECFVFNELRRIEDYTINFWRTTAKAEVDFILNNVHEIIPIEVKFREFKKGKIERSMLSFLKTYKPERALVITKRFWGDLKVNKTKIKFVPICYI